MRQRKSQRGKAPKQRAIIRLDWRLERKLIFYAAASAAGVAILACSPPAEARVVYTQVWVPISPTSSVTLDLNSDGIADFQFSNRYRRNSTASTCTTSRRCWIMKVLPQNQSNAVWGPTRTRPLWAPA